MGRRQPPPAPQGLAGGGRPLGGRDARPMRECRVRETHHTTKWCAVRTLHGERCPPYRAFDFDFALSQKAENRY